MQRISYCNGHFLPHQHANIVHIEDRGYQFADGVYEVMHVHHGVLVDLAPHLDRLDYSLGELGISYPCSSRRALESLMYEVIRRNRLEYGSIYVQVSRGVSKREFYFPKKPVTPSLVITAQRMQPFNPALLQQGIKIVTLKDARWKRCDIKSIALLAPVLAKQHAAQRGAYETWQVDEEGYITEGASTNAWIVKGKTLQTTPATHSILNGITRPRLMVLAKDMGLKILEKRFTEADILKADEAFLSSTTTYLLPLSSLNGKAVKRGTIALALREKYAEYCARATR